jgi:hypothetical protein
VFSEPGCSITGTAPTLAPGTTKQIFPISFIVKDSNGTVGGPFTLNLLVNQQSAVLNLPATIDTATIGTHYEYNFCDPAQQSGVNCAGLPADMIEGGSPPYTFTVSGQPLGLTMNMNGMLSGTVPQGATPGTYTITVCITDMVGTETCADTNLPVVEAQTGFQMHFVSVDNESLQTLAPRLHAAIVSDYNQAPPYRLVLASFSCNCEQERGYSGDNEFEQAYNVEGGILPYTFNLTSQLPGFSITNNGILQGTVPQGTAPGDYPMTICAMDSTGSSVCANTTLPVVKLNVQINSANCIKSGYELKASGTSSGTIDSRLALNEGGAFSISQTVVCSAGAEDFSSDCLISANAANAWTADAIAESGNPVEQATLNATLFIGKFQERRNFVSATYPINCQ